MNNSRVIVLLLMIILFVSGCQPAAPSPKSGLDAAIPEATNTSRPTTQTSRTPRPTTQPAPTETPTEAPAPRGAGVELALSRQAMEGANAFADEFAGVKEEVYFSGGYGGGSGVYCSTPVHSEPPLVGFSQGYGNFNQTVSVCVVGFPEEAPVLIQLYAPDGNLVSEKQITEPGSANSFTIEGSKGNYGLVVYLDPATIQSMSNPNLKLPTLTPDLTSKVWRDINISYLQLWTPVGLPQGEWRIVATSGELTRELFLILPTEKEGGQISILSGITIDPLVDKSPPEFQGRETVFIAGFGFPAKLRIPIGIYYETNEFKRDLGYVFARVFSTQVETSGEGDFLFTYQIEPDAADGTYVVMAEVQSGYFASPIDRGVRFVVNTGVGTATPAARAPQADNSFCPGAPLTRLEVGDIASISLVPPEANTVREKAGRKEKRLGLLQPGERIEILDGPKCADGWIWWKVISLETDLDGWTAEGDLDNYWLVPEN